MVRASKSKTSRRQSEQKKSSEPQLIPTDQSSSKILHVVRQALLNAAEELVSQQKSSSENQFSLDLNKNKINPSQQQQQQQQRNENARKKKAIVRKPKGRK
ncbi:hypothetical protein I4U23_030000 [Adineta vaga]|nr:hypothetical protein I4U23_030000 [Adineta vaga]